MSLQTEYVGKEALASIQDFPEMTLLYYYDEDMVVYKNGSAWNDSQHAVDKDKFHKAKMRWANENKGYYFLINGRRYFLNDAIYHG